MVIPKSIELMGETIKIKFVDTLTKSDDAVGMAKFRENIIELQRDSKVYPRNNEQITKTFFHELTHWIFFKLKKKDLNDDEELVDSIADLLAQAQKTAKYGK